MSWEDQQAQPRDKVEKANIASEVLGGKIKGHKPRAPRFHRMSISAAANGGVSIDHTAKVKVKAGKTGDTHNLSGASTPSSGEDSERHTGPHVFGADHEVMGHISAIHDAIMGSQDFDGDSD